MAIKEGWILWMPVLYSLECNVDTVYYEISTISPGSVFLGTGFLCL